MHECFFLGDPVYGPYQWAHNRGQVTNVIFRGPPIGLRNPHVELDLQLSTPPIRPHSGPKQQMYLGALQYGLGTGALTCYQNCRWGDPIIAEATNNISRAPKIQLRGLDLHLVHSGALERSISGALFRSANLCSLGKFELTIIIG